MTIQTMREYRETTRWFLRRLHQDDNYKIINLDNEVDISRSPRSVINLNRASFQHISKQHCIISCKNGVATLTDETSSTGTFVNHRKFCRQHPGSIILSEGDLIGIGTPCYQSPQFYKDRNHVLLYEVCKDRNRVVREGEVDRILSSEDESEDVKPNLKLIDKQDRDKTSQNNYRIVESIDLSSDEECEIVGVNVSADNPLPVQTKQNEVGANNQPECVFESQNASNTEPARDCNKESQNQQFLYPTENHEECTGATIYNTTQTGQAQGTTKEKYTKENADDQIDEIFRDSYENSIKDSDIPIIAIDDSDDDADEDDYSEQKLTQSFYRQIKKEALEIDIDDDEPELVDLEDPPTDANEPQDTIQKASDLVQDAEEDEQEFESSIRWYERLSQRSPPLKIKQEASSVLPEIIPLSAPDEPFEITDDYLSRDQNATDDFLEDFEQSLGILQQVKTTLHSNEKCDKLDAYKDKPNKDSGDAKLDINRKSKDIGITRIGTGKENSTLAKELQTNVIATTDDGEVDIADDFFDDLYTITEEQPKSNKETKKTTSVKEKSSAPLPGKRIVSGETSTSSNVAEEDKALPPPAKRLKSVDTANKIGSSSGTSIGEKQPVASKAPADRNLNSASNSWLSKKVPLVEPHRIKKRRTSNQSAAKTQAHSSSKLSPLRSSKPVQEVRKQKLKDIETKKSSNTDGSGQSAKTRTKPKVKFTPNNRGAFLTEVLPSSAKSNSSKETTCNSVNNNNYDDFICTQSTALENVPVPDIDIDIDIPLAKAPKLTFNSVAKVTSVGRDAPVFKIPKRRPSVAQKTDLSVESILSIIPDRVGDADKAKKNMPPSDQPVPAKKQTTIETAPSSEPVKKPMTTESLSRLEAKQDTLLSPNRQQPTTTLKSILKSPVLSKKSSKNVNWKESLVETYTYQIDEGNYLSVQTKGYKESKEFDPNESHDNYRNDIIKEITSWNADWFENPSESSIKKEALFPMVEEYKDFDSYKRIVMPILKLELFHDIVHHYAEQKKTTPMLLQMKVNLIRHQGQIFSLNCSVEHSNKQSICNKDYVLIYFKDKEDGKEYKIPAVVTTRRQQVMYAAEDGLKFFHCTLETAIHALSQRIRDGSAECLRLHSVTQINLHMRQFTALFNLKCSPLLENILSPRMNFYSETTVINPRAYKGKEKLNRQQGDILMSVYAHCLQRDQPHIMLIQGPPGTGKSKLISNLVLQLHRATQSKGRMKVLVCAQSNTAVDVIVLKLLQFLRVLPQHEQGKMLRTGTSNKVHPECRMVYLDDLARRRVNEGIKCRKLREEDPLYETYYLEKERLERKVKNLRAQLDRSSSVSECTRLDNELIVLQSQLNQVTRLLPEHINSMDLHDKDRRTLERAAKSNFVSMADIICTTLGSCSTLMEYCPKLKFDVCIIDEATQCTEIASLIPLEYGIKHMILVGDIKQLPPHVLSKDCADAGLKQSLFSRIQESFSGTQLVGIKMLTVQYRMHPEILKWPNEFFYEGKLTSDPDATSFNAFPFKPYTVFGLEYQQNHTQTEHQIYNNDEIQFVLQLLQEILQYCDRHTTIAIITPYSRHKRECEKYLRERNILQVSVVSIDSVQGQEYDVVIISLARSIGAGFLESPHRLNVALTRARKCLVVCGNFADLSGVKVWSSLLRDAQSRKLFYHVEEDDEYDDVNTFVEKVMRNLRKNPGDATAKVDKADMIT